MNGSRFFTEGRGGRGQATQWLRGPFLTLSMLLAVILVAGGASRADMPGQLLVRGASCLALTVAALVHAPVKRQPLGPVGWLLLATLTLVLLQLVPLPQEVWSSLPGRAFFIRATEGQAVWRPSSLVPGSTLNAALSLTIPIAVWVLVRRLDEVNHNRLQALLLLLITISMLTGLVQFSAGGFDNPLINETADMISGLFANRNHFALFLAIGCAIAPVWLVQRQSGWAWRLPLACGLEMTFLLMILASGSRAGMMLGGLGVVAGLLVSRPRWRHRWRYNSRWKAGAVILGATTVVSGLMLASVQADRARSVTRVMSLQIGEDMRVRAAPLVIDMTRLYFPVGSGFGGFDPVFRVHETTDLLKPTYFNRAHNDILEVVLDGGLLALVLLVSMTLWWTVASWRVWRQQLSPTIIRARLGSAIILLVLLSSAVDYPARTPMIMAILIVAALWLERLQETHVHQ